MKLPWHPSSSLIELASSPMFPWLTEPNSTAVHPHWLVIYLSLYLSSHSLEAFWGWECLFLAYSWCSIFAESVNDELAVLPPAEAAKPHASPDGQPSASVFAARPPALLSLQSDRPPPQPHSNSISKVTVLNFRSDHVPLPLPAEWRTSQIKWHTKSSLHKLMPYLLIWHFPPSTSCSQNIQMPA